MSNSQHLLGANIAEGPFSVKSLLRNSTPRPSLHSANKNVNFLGMQISNIKVLVLLFCLDSINESINTFNI